ncbi:hypothetical protein GOV11_05045 [Candidatus Woesearchaeota archaeon]|nr:hypothetical protein [Candidatus Woesearchaeota archaeon]
MLSKNLFVMFIVILLVPFVFSAPLQTSDFTYEGAFKYDDEGYGTRGMTFDASGDGGQGSLWVTGHDYYANLMEIGIPTPVTGNWDSLPSAQTLTPEFEFVPGGVGGAEYFSGIAHLGNDFFGMLWHWYNVAGEDEDKFYNPLNGNMQHVGPYSNENFHSNRYGMYLFEVPQNFANQYLDGQRLVAGSTREGYGASRGPSLVAFNPYSPVDATAIWHYPWNAYDDPNWDYGECLGDASTCLFPDWTACDVWYGGAWIEGKTILISGTHDTRGSSNYIPGGWDCSYSSPRILFYDEQDVVKSINGQIEPFEIIPYTYLDLAPYILQSSEIGGMAYDSVSGKLYVAEMSAGGYGHSAIHIFSVGEGVPAVCGDGYCNGLETCSSCSGDCGACPVCGNGVLESGEDCDDGNTNNGDGCSSSCQLEPGWEICPEGEITSQCLCGGAQRSSGYCCSGSYMTSVTCVSSSDCSGEEVCVAPNSCNSNCAVVDVNTGLAGYWTFDEGTGSAVTDYSGNGLDGYLSGGSWESGIIGGAYRFGGDGDSMTVPDNDILGLSAVTVSAWINADQYRTSCDGDCYNFIVAKSNWDDNREFRFRYHSSDGDIRWQVSADGVSTPEVKFDAATYAPAGSWHHIVGTWDSATSDILVYVDGVLRDSGTLSASNLYDGSAAFSVGSSGNNGGGLSDDWVGLVDDVRVYDRALAPEEVLVLFGGSSSCHWADSDCGGSVGISELVVVITSWMSGERSISELVEAIQLWQNG